LDQEQRRALVKELAVAVSTQAQVANRTWLALMSVALLAVLPRIPKPSGNVNLPFGLGEVDPIWFHAVLFSIFVVLAIAFASAHIQQARAQKLAQLVVDLLVADPVQHELVHPRELFDMWRMPSLNRVASLAQALRGKYQFFATAHNCPTWLRFVSIVYYALLKLAALTIYYGLPIWALWRAYYGVSLLGWLQHALAVGGLLAGFTLVQVFLSDAMYSVNVMKHLWRSERTPN